MDDNTIERVIPLMLSVLTVQKKHIIPPLFSKKASVFDFFKHFCEKEIMCKKLGRSTKKLCKGVPLVLAGYNMKNT